MNANSEDIIRMAKKSGAGLALTMSSPPRIASAEFRGQSLERYTSLVIAEAVAADRKRTEELAAIIEAETNQQLNGLLAALEPILKACDDCNKDDGKSLADSFTEEMEAAARAAVQAVRSWQAMPTVAGQWKPIKYQKDFQIRLAGGVAIDFACDCLAEDKGFGPWHDVGCQKYTLPCFDHEAIDR